MAICLTARMRCWKVASTTLVGAWLYCCIYSYLPNTAAFMWIDSSSKPIGPSGLHCLLTLALSGLAGPRAMTFHFNPSSRSSAPSPSSVPSSFLLRYSLSVLSMMLLCVPFLAHGPSDCRHPFGGDVDATAKVRSTDLCFVVYVHAITVAPLNRFRAFSHIGAISHPYNSLGNNLDLTIFVFSSYGALILPCCACCCYDPFRQRRLSHSFCCGVEACSQIPDVGDHRDLATQRPPYVVVQALSCRWF